MARGLELIRTYTKTFIIQLLYIAAFNFLTNTSQKTGNIAGPWLTH